MKHIKELGALIGLVVIVIVLALVWQFLTLEKAHSSFDEYAAFRGCTQILDHEENFGICTTADGTSLKLVELRGKWYLDGDLPTCWRSVCF